MKVGSLTLDPDQRITSADESARLLVGLSSLEGRALVAVLPPAEAADAQALRGTPPLDYLALGSPSGASLHVHLSPCPLGGFMVNVTSINEYLVEAQALARVQLRNTVESIIAGFAHEVRNPMAAILSLSEAALLVDASPDSPLVRIPGLVARVESLLKQSLAYSRPQVPRRALHQASFLLERATALLRPRETKVRLEAAKIDDAVPPVMVDALQLEQVLVNLIENALDAARTVVRLRISPGRTTAPSVCVEVSDDGPGITDDVAERIFDPFFTTKAHGTGLGLAIARDLARLNGGDLRHVADYRNGAAFRVYMPSTSEPLRGHW